MSVSDFTHAEFAELHLTECGKERCSQHKNIVFSAKNWHVLHYIMYGKGTYVLNDTEYKLSRGAVFYIPPHSSPRYFADKTNPWTYAWMGFDGLYAQSFLHAVGLNEAHPIWQDSPEFPLAKEFGELTDRFSSGGGKLNLDCFSAALKIIWEMTTRTSGERKLTAKECHINDAKEYIANNYQFSVTIKQIADGLGLSPNYLANIFDEVLGVSPKQYLTSYRMDVACEYLTATDMSIAEIAAKVGYDDPFHFSTAFSKTKKLSPRAYRQARKRHE